MDGLFPSEPVDRIVDGFQHVYYGEAEATTPEIKGLQSDWTAINEHLAELNRQKEEKDGHTGE